MLRRLTILSTLAVSLCFLFACSGSSENDIDGQTQFSAGDPFEAVSATGTLLSEDFQDSTANGFTSTGTWAFITDSGTSSIVYNGSSSSAKFGTIGGDSTWTDYTVSTNIKVTAQGGSKKLYFLGHASAYNTGYGLEINTNTSTSWKINAGYLNNGSFTAGSGCTQISGTGLANNTWYTVTLAFSGTTVTVSIDGVQKFSFVNSASTSGKIAFYSDRDTFSIDNVSVSGSGSAASPSPSATASAAVSPSPSATASSSPTTGDITVSNATQLSAAIISIAAGKTIWLNDGTYSFSSPLIIAESNSGSSGSMKKVYAVNKGKAILDFSGESVSDSNRGVILAGSYWNFYGVVVQKAGDNGMLLAGHYNTIDNCTFYANSDAGCQISRYNTSYTTIDKWPHNNTVSNCTSYGNYDVANGGENADGFAAKLTCGNGNVFTSCYSHHNSDDGWDLYTKTDTGAIGVITFTSCTAEKNGYQTSGSTTSNGDGNGFKLGDDAASVAHILTNCIANYNLGYGYTGNGNPAVFKVTNCTGTGNVKGLADRMNGSM
jgi:hypothetical protein